MIWSSSQRPRVAMRGTFSNRMIGMGSSRYASSVSHMPRRVSAFSAWYLAVRLTAWESSELNPLQGYDARQTSTWPNTARTSEGTASRQSAPGSRPWKARYWSRLNRSMTVPLTPVSRSKLRMAPGSTSIPP